MGAGSPRLGVGSGRAALLLLLLLCAVTAAAAADGAGAREEGEAGAPAPAPAGGGRYAAGQEVPVYVNKVGPYHNPQETYHYYSLPVCRPDRVRHRSLSLGEVLDGDRMAESLYRIAFRKDHSRRQLCQLQLDAQQVRGRLGAWGRG